MKGLIDIECATLRDCFLVIFQDSLGEKFVLISPLGHRLESAYEILSKYCDEENCAEGVPQDYAREIWGDLLNDGFKRMNDLEMVFNGKERDGHCVGYKIRNKKTGLYRSTMPSSWTSAGKVWSKPYNVKKHIATSKLIDFSEAEVVVLDEVTTLEIDKL